MASVSSKKKRKDVVIEDQSEDESLSSEEEDESDSDVDPQLEIQVEFEARNPEVADSNGIKQLLQQLLLKSHTNLSEITELILKQSKVGSVLKCIAEEMEDDDDDDDDANETYGISTVLNLNHHKAVPSIQEFVKIITAKCQNEKFLNILKDKHRNIGWLISERFINIPAHIAPPLYASLRSEINKACAKGKPFQFDYLLYMCKSYKIDNSNRKKKKKKKNDETQVDPEEIMFINAEDEILYRKAMVTFEYDVSDEGDILVAGKWREDDNQMTPYRTVMLIPWNQMEKITTEMEEFAA